MKSAELSFEQKLSNESLNTVELNQINQSFKVSDTKTRMLNVGENTWQRGFGCTTEAKTLVEIISSSNRNEIKFN